MTDQTRPTPAEIMAKMAGAGAAIVDAVQALRPLVEPGAGTEPDGPTVLNQDGTTVVLNISGDVPPETLEAAVRMATDMGQGKAPIVLAGPEDLVSQVRYVPTRIPVEHTVMVRAIERARERRARVSDGVVPDTVRRAEATISADLIHNAMDDGVTTVDRGDVMTLLQSSEIGSMHVEEIDLYRAAKFG